MALACAGVGTEGRHNTKFFAVGKDWQSQIVSGFKVAGLGTLKWLHNING